jgi:hypothetical protein
MKGVSEMLSMLKRIQDKFPDRVAVAIYQEAQIEMTEAKRRTPVDTGKLRASGQVAKPVREGNRISVTLSFGGAAIDYAIYVHENLEANHDSPPFGGGQAKFLESVLNESAPYMAARIAARIDLNKAKDF